MLRIIGPNFRRSKPIHGFIIQGRWLMSSSTRIQAEAEREHEVKTIGTHGGLFHCDEVLACYMLKVLPEYKNARIVRTRDPAVLKGCDIVVDVGGEYNPDTHRYDHHQRTFEDSLKSLTSGRKQARTQLSSAGLIYHHFGHRVISTISGIDPDRDRDSLEEVYDQVYANFVEEVDGADNKVSSLIGAAKTRYLVTTNIVHRVSRLNPQWNSPPSITSDDQFQLAMQLVGREFTEKITEYKDIWLPARAIVQRALESRFQVDESGEIIHLEQGCPWKKHLYMLIEKLSLPEFCIKLVVFRHTIDKDCWLVQAVPSKVRDEKNKVTFPPEWRGLSHTELCQVTGIPGCVFVHGDGFVGANLTYEGALAMARKALQMRTTSSYLL